MIERFSCLNSKLYAISEYLRLFNDNLRNLGFHVNARFASANSIFQQLLGVQFSLPLQKKRKKNEFYVTL